MEKSIDLRIGREARNPHPLHRPDIPGGWSVNRSAEGKPPRRQCCGGKSEVVSGVEVLSRDVVWLPQLWSRETRRSTSHTYFLVRGVDEMAYPGHE